MQNCLWKKGLVLGIILLFVGVGLSPVVTAVDNDIDTGHESIDNSDESGASDDYEEIITLISGRGNLNWTKRRGIFRGEVEIKQITTFGGASLSGLRRSNGGVEIYRVFDLKYVYAYRFIRIIFPFIWGIALGNIDWEK